MTYWGTEQATRIQGPDSVRRLALELAAPPSLRDAEPGAGQAADPTAAPRMTIGGLEFQVVADEDISEKDGLLHLERALVEDRTYNWQTAQPEDPIQWDFVLLLSNDAGQSRVAFDLEGPWIGEIDESGEVPRPLDAALITRFLRHFFDAKPVD
jgi:hypothetical protein